MGVTDSWDPLFSTESGPIVVWEVAIATWSVSFLLQEFHTVLLANCTVVQPAHTYEERTEAWDICLSVLWLLPPVFIL